MAVDFTSMFPVSLSEFFHKPTCMHFPRPLSYFSPHIFFPLTNLIPNPPTPLPQIDSFLDGFHELVPPELISIFDAQELELLISGLPDIDLDDLRAQTDYVGYKASDPQIAWFWSVLRSFSKEEKALFLQFVTGTAKVPLDGFQALQGSEGVRKFNIHKGASSSCAFSLPLFSPRFLLFSHHPFSSRTIPLHSSPHAAYGAHLLPSAHTCFNQLDLPEYPSEEVTREKLLVSIREGSEGFGFI